jgi:hypothetical protein
MFSLLLSWTRGQSGKSDIILEEADLAVANEEFSHATTMDKTSLTPIATSNATAKRRKRKAKKRRDIPAAAASIAESVSDHTYQSESDDEEMDAKSEDVHGLSPSRLAAVTMVDSSTSASWSKLSDS